MKQPTAFLQSTGMLILTTAVAESHNLLAIYTFLILKSLVCQKIELLLAYTNFIGVLQALDSNDGMGSTEIFFLALNCTICCQRAGVCVCAAFNALGDF